VVEGLDSGVDGTGSTFLSPFFPKKFLSITAGTIELGNGCPVTGSIASLQCLLEIRLPDRDTHIMLFKVPIMLCSNSQH
jgi:hypothetical protein